MLGHAYALDGDRQRAEEVLVKLAEASKNRYVPAWDMALIHLALGDTEDAFYWLGAAAQERAQGLVHAKVDLHLDPVRSNPRFEELLRRIGLAP